MNPPPTPMSADKIPTKHPIKTGTRIEIYFLDLLNLYLSGSISKKFLFDLRILKEEFFFFEDSQRTFNEH